MSKLTIAKETSLLAKSKKTKLSGFLNFEKYKIEFLTNEIFIK